MKGRLSQSKTYQVTFTKINSDEKLSGTLAFDETTARYILRNGSNRTVATGTGLNDIRTQGFGIEVVHAVNPTNIVPAAELAATVA